jgi:hypothetical protein
MPLTEAEARQALQKILDDFHRLSPEDRASMTEASVVRQFVDRLLRDVLGWPIEDPQRYKYELATQVGRPDITLIPEAGGTIFLEAKRFGVIKELQEARKTIQGVITPGQLALPGMAVDRTEEEQQAINYAFANGGTWAILTNFEKLRLFNARRDWLVLSFERPAAYLDEFEQLWQLAYPNILNGSLDRLSNQRYTRDVDTEYLAFINYWREQLAQDIVQRADQNPWVFHEDGSINLPVLRAVVQRFLDRLVIVRFAEDHLVLRPGTLRQIHELRQENPYTFSMDEFLDKFFRRFDEAHDSALFAEGLVDHASFSDDVLMPLISKLYEARYRSMPADIIGNTYEQYLGKALSLDDGSVTTRDNLETRKKQGSYYTPQVIVRYLVDTTLGRYLYGTADGQPDGETVDGETRKTSRDIRDLRVLDAACGSGSFLIDAYYVLADFYESEIERLEAEMRERNLRMAHDGISPLERELQLADYTVELDRIRDYPRLILETHLYGVDLDPQAAEIAVVNLIMRAMERRQHEKRLPQILNQNVKVGNSLIGLRPDAARLAEYADAIAEIRRLRLDLIHTPNGPAHKGILADLDVATKALTAALDADFEDQFTDLECVRPFHWGIEFPEVFFDEHGQLLEKPGFTIIVGNPPWEIVQPDLREYYSQFDTDIESKLTRKQVEARIAELNSEDPRRQTEFELQSAAIKEAATFYKQSGDYVYQGRGKSGTHTLFLERMYHLLRYKGRLGYVVPAGVYRELGTKEIREMLLSLGHIDYLFNFSNEKGFFPGIHHDFRFSLIGSQKGPQREGFWATFRFNPRVAVAPEDLQEFIADRSNLIFIQETTLSRFSPNSLSVMEFETEHDYQIAGQIYGNWHHLGDQVDGSWNPRFAQEINLTSKRRLFNTRAYGLPLYEGKMMHQYDAFFSEPQFWLEEAVGREAVLGQVSDDGQFLGYQRCRLAFRDVSNATNERTLIAAILPPYVFAGNTAIVETEVHDRNMLFLIALLNSFCDDYLIRHKINVHVNMFYMYQMPLPRLSLGNPYFDAIVPRAARLTCTRAEFEDLWHKVMGEHWDESKGATDPAERQRLRDEIDAIVAHLYGLSRADLDHILGTFPLVFPDDEAGWAKRESLLDTFDKLAAAFRR